MSEYDIMPSCSLDYSLPVRYRRFPLHYQAPILRISSPPGTIHMLLSHSSSLSPPKAAISINSPPSKQHSLRNLVTLIFPSSLSSAIDFISAGVVGGASSATCGWTLHTMAPHRDGPCWPTARGPPGTREGDVNNDPKIAHIKVYLHHRVCQLITPLQPYYWCFPKMRLEYTPVQRASWCLRNLVWEIELSFWMSIRASFPDAILALIWMMFYLSRYLYFGDRRTHEFLFWPSHASSICRYHTLFFGTQTFDTSPWTPSFNMEDLIVTQLADFVPSFGSWMPGGRRRWMGSKCGKLFRFILFVGKIKRHQKLPCMEMRIPWGHDRRQRTSVLQ